jgi:hypothetical protein
MPSTSEPGASAPALPKPTAQAVSSQAPDVAIAPTLPSRPWDLTWLPEKLKTPDGKPGRILDLTVTSLEPLQGARFQTEVAVLGRSSESPGELGALLFSGAKLVCEQRAGLGGQQVVPDFDVMMWDERDLDFGAIERMAAEAPTRAGIPDGKTSYVKCARSMLLSCAVQCIVAVSGGGRDALAYFDGKGEPWKVPLVPMSDCARLLESRSREH